MSIQTHKRTNVAYHFLVEAMIIFLFAVPFMEYKYQWTPPPFWGYLGLAAGACLLYSLYSRYTAAYTWYIWTAPLLIGVFYVSGYPFFLSAVFPILFTFRYIFLRKDFMLKNEMVYMNVTIVWSVILFIWLKDPQVIIYDFLILVLLLTGHIFSHYMAIDKQQKNTMKPKLWMTIGTIIGSAAVASLLLYLFRHVFTRVWEMLLTGVKYVTSAFVLLLEQLLPNPESLDRKEENESSNNDAPGQENDVEDLLPDQEGSSLIEAYDYLIYWGIGIVILLIVIFLAIRHYRNRFQERSKTEKPREVVTHSKLNETAQQKASLFDRVFQAPEHKVRKLIFHLEREAAKADSGRFSYETLDSWLNRLGLTIDMTIYKKVRYGNVEEVSESEIQTLKMHLKEIRQRLKNKQ